MANNGVTWKFIVQKAAWWVGFWERMVQTVKRTLKKVIGRSCLSFEELGTLLNKVEGVVNAGPLTYVYDDLDDFNFVLTITLDQRLTLTRYCQLQPLRNC